jgi:hypothetical protein
VLAVAAIRAGSAVTKYAAIKKAVEGIEDFWA